MIQRVKCAENTNMHIRTYIMYFVTVNLLRTSAVNSAALLHMYVIC